MRWKDTPEDRRRQLADDLRRISGFLAAALAEAHALGVDVPEEIDGADEGHSCVAAIAAWSRQLRADDDPIPRSR